MRLRFLLRASANTLRDGIAPSERCVASLARCGRKLTGPFSVLLRAIVTANHLNGVFIDRAGNRVVPSHWRMLQNSCLFSMECFWRWPEDDCSGSFSGVPMCENNDSKSRFQPQGWL